MHLQVPRTTFKNIKTHYEIPCSHGGVYEDDSLLGYSVLQSR
jgi:hypothetical protein